jgi:hypothetical protein
MISSGFNDDAWGGEAGEASNISRYRWIQLMNQYCFDCCSVSSCLDVCVCVCFVLVFFVCFPVLMNDGQKSFVPIVTSG